MSEEQHNEETEVEGHLGGKSSYPQKFAASDEPRDEAETEDEVEGHLGGKTSIPKPS